MEYLCEHLVQELYDYALEHKLAKEIVDYELNQQYLRFSKRYLRCDESEKRALEVRICDETRSELEKFVRGKDGTFALK